MQALLNFKYKSFNDFNHLAKRKGWCEETQPVWEFFIMVKVKFNFSKMIREFH